MKTSDIADPLFLQAVNSLDSGDVVTLESLLQTHPRLVTERLNTPNGQGYFKDPYLLWFVADNPIRNDKLPVNIVEVTQLLLKQVKQQAPASFQEQIDYTLGLVVTGLIPKECGVQVAMTDLLISEGANLGDPLSAIAHGNPEIARYLVEKGAKVSLATAICLGLGGQVEMLSKNASSDDLQETLVSAAFHGDAEGIKHVLQLGADPNGYIDPRVKPSFHSHGTALHQAVSSGSLAAVRMLVEAGALTDLKDKIFGGTPIEWAEHMVSETTDEDRKQRYLEIERFLWG
ncbi:ankyrin repeat domain-containing protein [uncultured Imperialibacter sp.]|uniref:ankyrin repeat domain-containing protein n=1 Tax=uncultured Imperialibacter sp. TaxID=1672639 RepID=UPI0030DCC42E|tara:strand:- start:58327 stop:59190 length:864 start_codon:yes stop_codon:yes gene_type:complete